MELCELWAELREEAGMTQEELAKRIGVSRSTVGSYEAGNSQPGYAVLIKMADIYDVSLDFLLGHSKIRNAEALLHLKEDNISAELLKNYASLTKEHRALLEKIGCLLAKNEIMQRRLENQK